MADVNTDGLDSGLQALKDDKLIKAEHEFTKSGDYARLAEVKILQYQESQNIVFLDEAESLVAGKEDGQAKLMHALVCKERGELQEYHRRLVEAKNLQNHVAECLLEAGG